MNISFRQLRAFTTIGRLGSFVDAANALHVTPAALSIMIRSLEDTLGFRVFDRTTRRVTLTEAGQQYFQQAEQVLIDLRHAELLAQDIRSRKTGVVRIATTQVVIWTLLPKIFAAFHKKWPDIRIEPIDVPNDQIISSVENNQADLAITFKVPVAGNIEATPLFSSRSHVVCNSRHRFARRKSLSWTALSEEPIIFIGRGSELRIRSELPQEIILNSRYEVNNTSTALALAASGAGVAICAGYVRPMTQMHNLSIIALSDPVIRRPFMLYRNCARSMGPAVEEHRSFLLDYFAKADGACVEDVLLP
ncbi:MAG: LysR family transcriptional regulator [Pseudomonadota bacterium]